MFPLRVSMTILLVLVPLFARAQFLPGGAEPPAGTALGETAPRKAGSSTAGSISSLAGLDAPQFMVTDVFAPDAPDRLSGRSAYIVRQRPSSMWASVDSTPQVPPADEPSAERKGFIIGFGVGPGLHRRAGFTVQNQAGRVIFEDPGARTFGFTTDLKVGYAPTDRFLTYYSNKVGFSNDEEYDAVGVTGFGVTYMTRATSPTPFVSGSFGIGVGRRFVGRSVGESGIGWSVGGGYEFARRWSVDGDAIFVRLGNGDNHMVFKSSINFLFY